MLWEWLPRDEAAHALAHVDVSIFKDNLTLADDHQGGAVALHALEDVILHSLQEQKAQSYFWTTPRVYPASAWHTYDALL